MLKNTEIKNVILGRVPGMIELVYKNSSALKDLIVQLEKSVREFPIPVTSPIWGMIMLALEEGEKHINLIAKEGQKGLSDRFSEVADPYRSMKENVKDFVYKYQSEAKDAEMRQAITEIRAIPGYDFGSSSLVTRAVMFCREKPVMDTTMLPEEFLDFCKDLVESVTQTINNGTKSQVKVKKTQLKEIKKAKNRLIKALNEIPDEI